MKLLALIAPATAAPEVMLKAAQTAMAADIFRKDIFRMRGSKRIFDPISRRVDGQLRSRGPASVASAMILPRNVQTRRRCSRTRENQRR
jgi:hypothetical protein